MSLQINRLALRPLPRTYGPLRRVELEHPGAGFLITCPPDPVASKVRSNMSAIRVMFCTGVLCKCSHVMVQQTGALKCLLPKVLIPLHSKHHSTGFSYSSKLAVVTTNAFYRH